MKIRNILLLSLATGAFATPVFAQAAPPSPPAPGHFERVDTNRDGAITREEARAAHSAQFAIIDTNRDGFLAHDEMRAHHAAQRQVIREVVINQHRDNIDVDKNGTISLQEWNNGPILEREQRQKMHQDRFTALDTNRDGQLSAQEFSAGRQHGQQRGIRGQMEERRMDGQRNGPNAGGPAHRPKHDTNNDGKISRAEWDAMELPMFSHGDTNNDGRITREEAAAAVRNHRPQNGRGGPQGGRRMFKDAPPAGAN